MPPDKTGGTNRLPFIGSTKNSIAQSPPKSNLFFGTNTRFGHFRGKNQKNQVDISAKLNYTEHRSKGATGQTISSLLDYRNNRLIRGAMGRLLLFIGLNEQGNKLDEQKRTAISRPFLRGSVFLLLQ